MGFAPWPKNPRFCRECHKSLAKLAVGGAELETPVLFADVRGSTTMAEQMRPGESRELIARFYRATEAAIIDADGLVDNEPGDEVMALFIPRCAGNDHASLPVSAGRAILHATGNGTPSPWVRPGQ